MVETFKNPIPQMGVWGVILRGLGLQNQGWGMVHKISFLLSKVLYNIHTNKYQINLNNFWGEGGGKSQSYIIPHKFNKHIIY